MNSALSPAVALRMGRESDALCIGVLGSQVWCDAFAPDGLNPSLAKEVVEYFSTAVMAHELSSPNLAFVIAEMGDKMVGFAQLDGASTQPLAPQGPTVELHRLYVLRSHTGRGIGKALLQKSEAWAKDQGANSVWLTTWLGNERALSFFKRMSYSEVGADKYTFEDQAYENRILARKLSACA